MLAKFKTGHERQFRFNQQSGTDTSAVGLSTNQVFVRRGTEQAQIFRIIGKDQSSDMSGSGLTNHHVADQPGLIVKDSANEDLVQEGKFSF